MSFACQNEQVRQTALANPLDNFELGVRKLFKTLMLDRLSENDGIVTRYLSDAALQNANRLPLLRKLDEAVRKTIGIRVVE